MPFSMKAEKVMDENEFPSLSAATKAKPSVTFKEPNDWELLDQQETGFERDVVVVETTNPKSLRHCRSSPDLRRFALDAVDEEDEEEKAASTSRDDFSMISGPGSVVSVASGFSFRDAILSPPSKEARSDEPKPSSEGARTKRQQQRIKPRFVVKPIKRCAKSTGDLQSLAIQEEEVMGETDAMDFYHRKAKGHQGRQNGLKLRPDEAKRKAITMHKKELQRQGKR